jgi:hypothetical protein
MKKHFSDDDIFDEVDSKEYEREMESKDIKEISELEKEIEAFETWIMHADFSNKGLLQRWNIFKKRWLAEKDMEIGQLKLEIKKQKSRIEELEAENRGYKDGSGVVSVAAKNIGDKYRKQIADLKKALASSLTKAEAEGANNDKEGALEYHKDDIIKSIQKEAFKKKLESKEAVRG